MFTYLVLGSFALSLQIFYAQFKIGLLLPSRGCFNGNLKVSDFGLSALPEQIKNGLLDMACGTPAYTAPEIHCRQNYEGPKADAWSCGLILFVLLAGHLPFNDFNISTMYRKISKRDYQISQWISKPARYVIYHLLDPNPITRMSLEALS